MSNETKIRKAHISTRLYGPCDCGCKGSDPWHKAFFVRNIKEIRQASPSESFYISKLGECNDVLRVGRCKMPWGFAVVVERKLFGLNITGWYVASRS